MGHKEVPVTQLRKMVLEELERRNYSQATARPYVGAIQRFAEHFHRSPDQLGPEHIREYQLHLVQDRKLHPRTVMIQMSALRFFFRKVLKRRFDRDDLPLPKLLRRQIPTVLSRDEVARLIAAAGNLRHRTILMALYATGMRRAELCHLRIEDIDKERMVLHIRQGKGGKDREVPLPPKLLAQLRIHYRALPHRSAWVFPSLQSRRPDQPMTEKAVWHACRQAAWRAGITKSVHPHTLRHCFATHLLDNGAELPVIQVLLGHSDPRDTMIYLHLCTRQLRAAPNPLDTLPCPSIAGRERATS
uniref:Phage integrase family protein n=1 Tax=Solibacter usitatus (strain Ellin6076) TaxID=234267 RepID=Q01TI9_SOLUE